MRPLTFLCFNEEDGGARIGVNFHCTVATNFFFPPVLHYPRIIDGRAEDPRSPRFNYSSMKKYSGLCSVRLQLVVIRPNRNKTSGGIMRATWNDDIVNIK